MNPVLFILLGTLSAGMNASAPFSIPGPSARAPVVHLARYHILTCGRTSVVLDGARGLSIALIGERQPVEKTQGSVNERAGPGSLQVELTDGGRRILLDQANDPGPRLQIISQGPTHVAARAFFSMCSADGKSFGTGTLDIMVYEDRVHLVPSVFVDYLSPAARVARAGLTLGLAEGTGSALVRGERLTLKKSRSFERFGGAEAAFDVTFEQADGGALKLGWLRNRYPQLLYLREVDRNPETDELYERWPLWISQRGSPLGWGFDDSSGLEVEQAQRKPSKISLLWVRDAAVPSPAGGYVAFNAPLAIVQGRSRAEAESLWDGFSRPLAPAVEAGDFRFYNEIDGLYELDTHGQPVSLAFDATKETSDRVVLVRLWNLEGRGAHVFRVDDEPAPFSLMNDGDVVDDPMVFIVKNATGPARTAIVSVSVPKGKKVRFRGVRKPGLQLAYQMYSDLETYEAWSERCDNSPLFRFHLREIAIYQATYPGARDYAFFKLPLYFLKNGVNPSTFANQLRDFEVVENGPDEILFSVRSVTTEATGLSSYTCRIPNAPEVLSFELRAEFVALDDGARWTSLEYCDLYPFEDVYRSNFHYRDVTYLNRSGAFDRVGSGAWKMRFRAVEEPARMGYYSELGERQGPGSKVPGTRDGSVWILGSNAERGNVLFRRGQWEVSAGAEPVFALCNAWMDLHNSIAEPSGPGAVEKLSYAVDIFPVAVPPLDVLNRLYQRDVGKGITSGIKAVRYSPRGEIVGFVPE
jgi:hypothetical protein